MSYSWNHVLQVKSLSDILTNIGQSMQIARHIKHFHEKQRNFQCTKCDKKFSRNHHLKRHMETHESDTKKFECMFCGVRLRRREQLEKHMLKACSAIKEDKITGKNGKSKRKRRKDFGGTHRRRNDFEKDAPKKEEPLSTKNEIKTEKMS